MPLAIFVQPMAASQVRQVLTGGRELYAPIAKHSSIRREHAARIALVRASSASSSTTSAPRDRRSEGAGPGAAPSWTQQRDSAKMMTQLQELVKEAFKLSAESGPKGVIRGMQAGQAVLEVGRDYVAGGQADPPERVLRKLFEKLGATYIKLGQFIASSPSLFPAEYVTEFQKCLDRADPIPFAAVKRTITEELTLPVDQVFSYIDPSPLAVASIAQVHEAVLRGSDKAVVLKVLKPGVQDVLSTDLNFLLIATKFLQIVNPELERTSIAGIIEDIRNSMLDEVDFQKEAQHIRQFGQYLDSAGMRSVATCPFVYQQYSSRRLITMEKLEGAALTDLDSIRLVTTADPETTLINALNTWFGSVMYCETFHADVHAGNLLVMADGRVGFLDFGIVGRVSPVTWKAVEALMAATTMSDYDTMARALATMKATDQQVNIPAFAKDLELLFEEINSIDSEVILSGRNQTLSANVVVDDAQINRLLLELVRVGEVHGVRFPREFGLLIKQLLYFDRYIKLLAPGLEVMKDTRVSLGDLSANGKPSRGGVILEM